MGRYKKVLPEETRARIHELRGLKWSMAAIADELGIGIYVVRRICTTGEPSRYSRFVNKSTTN